MRELNAVQTELLHIMEHFMHQNGSYHLSVPSISLPSLHQLAMEHKIASVTYEALCREPLMRQEENAALASAWKRMTMREVMMQVQRTDGFLRIYQKLCDAGMKPLVVKGVICRSFYAKPDYRTSGDEDMLLRPEEFEACDAILLSEGFEREDVDPTALPHEIPYRNPRNGVYIELHLSLFPEESGAYGHLNREFAEVFAHCIQEKIQGTDIWTLNPTDHLFYLICHSFKHFLHSGFGIRQVCDMVMMAEHYGEQIDWAYIDEALSRLRMDTFWSALVQIGIQYLGFSTEKSAYPEKMLANPADCSRLLLDLMDSGIYGDRSAERKHSSNMTLAAAKNGKKDTVASVKSSLFPGMEYMKKNYLWLERYPWLVPAAYMNRMIRYAVRIGKVKREGDGQENSVEIGMERVELLREYGIID